MKSARMPQVTVWVGCLAALLTGCSGPWAPRHDADGPAGMRAVSPHGNGSPVPLEVANQAIDQPDDVGANQSVRLARQFEESGNAPAALRQYQRALELEPENQRVLIGYARLLDREERFEEAVALYRRAIEAEPEHPTAHNDLALCLARHGRHDEALEAFQTAVRLKPERKLYRNNLATLLVDLGRPQPALEQLMQVHPPAVAHYNLGHLLLQQDRAEQARQEFLVAVDLDPQLTEARRMLERSPQTSAPPTPAPAKSSGVVAVGVAAAARPDETGTLATVAHHEPPGGDPGAVVRLTSSQVEQLPDVPSRWGPAPLPAEGRSPNRRVSENRPLRPRPSSSSSSSPPRSKPQAEPLRDSKQGPLPPLPEEPAGASPPKKHLRPGS